MSTDDIPDNGKKAENKKTNIWLILGIIFVFVLITVAIIVAISFFRRDDSDDDDVNTSFPLPAVSGLPTWYAGLEYYTGSNNICSKAMDETSIGWVFENKTDLSFNCQVQYIYNEEGCTGSYIDPNPNSINIAPNLNSVWTNFLDLNKNFKTFYQNTEIICTNTDGSLGNLSFAVPDIDPENSYMLASLKLNKNTGEYEFKASQQISY